MNFPKGSRLLAWFIVIAGTVLSAYIKESVYFVTAASTALALYANKQFQERKSLEVQNGNKKLS